MFATVSSILIAPLFILVIGSSNPIFAHGISAEQEEESIAEPFEEIEEPVLSPDNPFYFLKGWGEFAEVFFAQTDGQRAELEAKFAERRVGEMKKLARMGREDLLEKLRERWQEHIENAQERIEKTKDKKEEVREKVLEATSKHLAVLERVYENAPDKAREGLQRAIDNAKDHQQKMLERFSKDRHKQLKEHLEKRFDEFRKEHNLDQERFRKLDPNESEIQE